MPWKPDPDSRPWLIPERPGLGVEVSEATVAKHPFKQEIMHAGNAMLADGTIVDW